MSLYFMSLHNLLPLLSWQNFMLWVKRSKLWCKSPFGDNFDNIILFSSLKWKNDLKNSLWYRGIWYLGPMVTGKCIYTDFVFLRNSSLEYPSLHYLIFRKFSHCSYEMLQCRSEQNNPLSSLPKSVILALWAITISICNE